MRTMLPPSVAGTRLGVTALTVLTAAGATWLATPTAMAAPGDGGDIRIHDEHVPYGVSKDDPEVCKFYLDAVNFDSAASVSYTITAQPPLATSATVTGTLTLAQGAGHTDALGLADGQYLLTWTPQGGAAKTKVFQVDCHDERKHGNAQGPGGHSYEDPSGSAGAPGDKESEGPKEEAAWGEHESGGPKGGVHAGGGGLADTAQAYTPLSAAAGVGLVAVSAAVYFRMLRRRSHGAA